jgi:hypothetical protein
MEKSVPACILDGCKSVSVHVRVTMLASMSVLKDLSSRLLATAFSY